MEISNSRFLANCSNNAFSNFMADDIKMTSATSSFIGSLKELALMHPNCSDDVTLLWLDKASKESAVIHSDFDLEAAEYLAQKLQQTYRLPLESLQAVVVDMIHENFPDAHKALLGLAMFTVLKDTNNIDFAKSFLDLRINQDVKLYQELQQKISDLAKRNSQPSADVENPQLNALSKSSEQHSR